MDNTKQPSQVPASQVRVKSAFASVFWNNMGILVVYEMYARLFGRGDDAFAFALAFAYIPHAIILFFSALATREKEYRRSLMLTSLAVLVVGFGACVVAVSS